jgi:hypothetical protein
MKVEMVEVTVWVLVDENGDVAVSQDADELQAEPGLATRLVKVTLNVPKPKPVELVATVEAEPETAELKVA